MIHIWRVFYCGNFIIKVFIIFESIGMKNTILGGLSKTSYAS